MMSVCAAQAGGLGHTLRINKNFQSCRGKPTCAARIRLKTRIQCIATGTSTPFNALEFTPTQGSFNSFSNFLSGNFLSSVLICGPAAHIFKTALVYFILIV
jgi:hypothetical protein